MKKEAVSCSSGHDEAGMAHSGQAPASAPGAEGSARFTPGPWESHGVWLFGSGTAIAKMRYGGADEPGFEGARANAMRIVQCVNERDELVSLLRRWVALDAGAWHPAHHANDKARLVEETRAAIEEQL